MPLYTEHLNLVKPTRDERYNIAVPNGNMDVIDEHVRLLEEKNQLLEEEVAALRGELANKANAGTPETYALELAEGIGDGGTYSKTQEGLVHIRFWCSRKDEHPLEDGQIIAILPEGFRPNGKFLFYGGLSNLGGIRQSTRFAIDADGTLIVEPFYGVDLSLARACSGSAIFVAAQ